MHDNVTDDRHVRITGPPNETILAKTRLFVIADATRELFPSPTRVDAVTQN